MRFELIWRAPDDVGTSTIRSPSRNSRGKPFVGIGNAPVMLFLELVFYCVGSWVAALPERFDKLLSLFVRRELQERGPLFVADDVGNFLFEPFLVGSRKLFLKFLKVLALRSEERRV